MVFPKCETNKMEGKQPEKHVHLCNSSAIVKGVANICLNAATGQNQSVVL